MASHRRAAPPCARQYRTRGYDALAAAHSRGLARLSREIADGVLALERSGQ